MAAPNSLSTVLKRIREARPAERPRPGERCELCDEPIPDEHGHIVDLHNRSLLCSCRGCYMVFSPDGSGGNRFRAVPDRYLRFDAAASELWEHLEIPVGVAFFFFNSASEELATFYPSPAGATESLLPIDAWREMVAANPEFATLRPDVEALLVRTGDSTRAGEHAGGLNGDEPECFLVPIDVCYELVGTLRQQWRGFDGGSEVHATMADFFGRVRARATAGASR